MIVEYKDTVNQIRTEISEYITRSGLKSLILGVSGGIDSALCAALARPVCDNLNIPLICRSLTIETNKPDEIKRAALVGEAFGTDFKEVDLTDVFQIFKQKVVEDFEHQNKDDYNFKIRMGNVKARTRMIYLYELAGKNKGMVLSTDNYTELLLGFWTLHGDVGDYGMIQNLWKTEVYEMSRFLALEMKDAKKQEALIACIEAIPTDGLGITNSDLDQIGAKSYEEVDKILIQFMSGNGKDFENHPVVKRKLSSEFKRNNPYNIPRERFTSIKLF